MSKHPDRFHRSLLWLSLAFLILAMLALSPVCASAQTGPIAAIVAGNSLDAWSTEKSLQNPALTEGNAILGQSATRRIALKSASTAFQVWIVRKVGRTHPKTARVLGYGAGAVLTGIAVRNTRMGR